jgi:hypothetical protein
MSDVAPEGLVLCDSVALSKNDPVVGATNGNATALGVLSEGSVLPEGAGHSAPQWPVCTRILTLYPHS